MINRNALLSVILCSTALSLALPVCAQDTAASAEDTTLSEALLETPGARVEEAPAVPAKPILDSAVPATGLEKKEADYKAVVNGAEDPAKGPTTLRQAVQFGVTGNPEYGKLQSNREATRWELEQAKALYRPSIDLSSQAGFEHTDDANTRGGLDDDDTENMAPYDVSLTLTQMLYDGGETLFENKRQQARTLSAANRVQEAAELIGLSVVEAYLEILRQTELLRLTQENVKAHEDILNQIQDSTGAGRSTEADVQQVMARLSSARAMESNVRRQLDIAVAAYIREAGVRPDALVMPDVPYARLARTLEDEVDMSLANSPTLSIFDADVDVAEHELEGSKASFMPEVNFQMNGRTGHDLSGIEGRDTSASAFVRMNWNLYRGGGDTARVQEFKYRHSQSKEAYGEAARDVEDQVRQTWARMVSANFRASQFAEQAMSNAKVVASYKDQFNLSRRTLLDVLDAQNELYTSQSNGVNERFVSFFSVYSLLAYRGELLKALEVSLSDKG